MNTATINWGEEEAEAHYMEDTCFARLSNQDEERAIQRWVDKAIAQSRACRREHYRIHRAPGTGLLARLLRRIWRWA